MNLIRNSELTYVNCVETNEEQTYFLSLLKTSFVGRASIQLGHFQFNTVNDLLQKLKTLTKI